ncbi:protein arginine N-methyltransferase 2 isoform X4 [Gymnodraco acuticeps]|uniref:type I protein arginine methyltransferase n=1 Tax=Gymnodraco acuticeps TaxID=8218 RepID=A0A6P8T801_GYMAC|nr:protein arginine N-methyltransferase 2 isoform X4 [Gymnodraco acuticeps]
MRLHLEMLSNRRRTEAYRQVILSNSAPLRNKVVMDLSCGTGIISLFCAQLARPPFCNVFAVEASSMAEYTRQLVKQNGCEEVVLQGRAEDIHLPERVDILVSEWMGNCLLFEFMVESVLLARDCWLEEGGVMWPSSAALTLVPCQANSYYAEKMAFWEQPYGLDCTPVHFNSHLIDPSDCLTAPCDALLLDMYTLEIKDLEANALEADSVHAGPAGQSFGGRLHRWNHRPAQEPCLETPHDHHPALEY